MVMGKINKLLIWSVNFLQWKKPLILLPKGWMALKIMDPSPLSIPQRFIGLLDYINNLPCLHEEKKVRIT